MNMQTPARTFAPAASQEPRWQGEFRFQAWTADALQLDLTIADGEIAVFGGLAKGFRVLLDRADVTERLSIAVAAWSAPEFDAASLDASTWAWFRYLKGRLRRGEYFAVRAGLHETLMSRVIPLFGSEWHSAASELSPADMLRIHAAAPGSADPVELSRALRAVAEVYESALDRWAERTGNARPGDPLQEVTLDLLTSS